MKVSRGVISLGVLLAAVRTWGMPPPAIARLDVSEDPQGTVRICESLPMRSCPDAGVLREDVRTGEVVKLDACVDGCWVDECVPGGTYRYGLADPYECVDSYAQYYTEVAVVGIGEGCTRTLPAPEPATGVPWPAGRQWVCGRPQRPEPAASCGASPEGPGLGTNVLLALAAGLSIWRRRVRRSG